MVSVEKLLNTVIAYYEKKEYASAEQAVDNLITAYPQFHRGQFLKAIILEETGRSEEAEKHYVLSGNRFTLWSRLALQLHDIDPPRAITYYERVIEADPHSNLMWFNLGSLYERIGRHEEARKRFRNISPGKEITSKILVPVGFIAFLIGGATFMLQRGEKSLSMLVLASAMFCFFWLYRDLGRTVQMVRKKVNAK